MLRSQSKRNITSRHFLNVFSNVIYDNRIGVLLNGLTFFLLWIEPQGKDLVLSLNQDGRISVLLFYSLMFLLAAIIWYAPRFIYKNYFKDGSLMSLFRDNNQLYYSDVVDPLKGHLQRMIPRIMGGILLLTTAFAFINILIEYQYTSYAPIRWPVIGIPLEKASVPYVLSILMLCALVFPRVYDFVKRFLMQHRLVVSTLLISLFAFQSILVFNSNTAYNSIQQVFYIGLILTAFFIGFVLSRKSLIYLKGISNKVMMLALVISIVLGILPFILSNFVLLTGHLLWDVHMFHPLIILFSGLIFYVVLIMLLLFVGKATRFKIRGRVLKFRYLSVAIVLWAVMSEMNRDNGQFDITTVQHSEISPGDRPDLTTYFDGWLAHRKSYIEQFVDFRQT